MFLYLQMAQWKGIRLKLARNRIRFPTMDIPQVRVNTCVEKLSCVTYEFMFNLFKKSMLLSKSGYFIWYTCTQPTIYNKILTS